MARAFESAARGLLPSAAVRGVFTRIARGYDRMNRLMTLGLDLRWRRKALELAGEVSAAARVLDLAVGTGDFALAAARRWRGARIVGVDLTPAMLEIAARKVARAGFGARISLVAGDAMRMDFPDASFDVVTCGFGFRNFPDKACALCEAARVLKPGGALIVLELFRQERKWRERFTMAWLRLAARFFARGRPAEYAYLRESMAKTCSRGEFIALAEACGFDVDRAAFFFPACDCAALRRR